jgi:hypothetical protein
MTSEFVGTFSAYRRVARRLSFVAAGLLLLLSSTARADPEAQARVVRDFFERYADQIGQAAHPILAVQGLNHGVSADASGALVRIRYASGDTTDVLLALGERNVFARISVGNGIRSTDPVLHERVNCQHLGGDETKHRSSLGGAYRRMGSKRAVGD